MVFLYNLSSFLFSRTDISVSDEGDIIITTKSGGASPSGIIFRGIIQPSPNNYQESTIFVDETHTFQTYWDKNR